MRKCFFVVLVVAYPVVLNAQEGIPADFWDSRVSVAFYPEVRVTVGELSESINTEVDGCDWRDSDGTNIFLMECLVSRGLTEVLLQFVFDWRSAQRVSRLEAYEGFSGEKFDDPMLALLMLAPPTPLRRKRSSKQRVGPKKNNVLMRLKRLGLLVVTNLQWPSANERCSKRRALTS